MESMNLTLNEKIEKELESNLQESLKNEEFKKLVNRLHISKEDAKNNNTSLMDTVEELENCKTCKGLFMCKNKVEGNVLYPSNEETLKFIYMPCKYKKTLEKKRIEKEELLHSSDNIRMKDILIDDKNRVNVIKWLKKYFDNYEKFNTLKGLYLHGSFGSGKTFLITALFNELKAQKNANTCIIYFPELLRSIKEDFSSMEEKIDYLKNVDLLLFDDIGAENVTSWGRDEVLGTILQYRMDNKLSTFFTSNLSIDELEVHLSITKDSTDKVKAKRIIERIKQLSDIEELITNNKRL